MGVLILVLIVLIVLALLLVFPALLLWCLSTLGIGVITWSLGRRLCGLLHLLRGAPSLDLQVNAT